MQIVFRLWTRLFAAIYGGEGLNIPLMFMPTRAIAPLLRKYGARIGQNVRFRSPLVIHNSNAARGQYYRNLTIGNDCYLGRELFLDLQDKIRIAAASGVRPTSESSACPHRTGAGAARITERRGTVVQYTSPARSIHRSQCNYPPGGRGGRISCCWCWSSSDAVCCRRDNCGWRAGQVS